MVGFRNVAIHDYRRPDLVIVKEIFTAHLDDFSLSAPALIKQSDWRELRLAPTWPAA